MIKYFTKIKATIKALLYPNTKMIVLARGNGKTRLANKLVEFKNGSVIEYRETTEGTSRGGRSSLITFYCQGCRCIHENYPIEDMVIFGEHGTSSISFCKYGLINKILRDN